MAAKKNSSAKSVKPKFNLANSIEAIDRLSDDLFTRIVRLENIKTKYPLLRKILAGDEEIIKKLKNDEEFGEKLKEITDWFDNFIEKSFDEIFFGIPYLGLAVFFMPGTDDPVSVFYGDWGENKEDEAAFDRNKFYINRKYNHYHKDHFRHKKNGEKTGRIFEISKLMRYMDDELKNTPSGSRVISKKHFFFWIKSFIDLQCIEDPSYTPMYKNDNYILAKNTSQKSKSLSVLISPFEKSLVNPKISFTCDNKGLKPQKITLEWDVNGKKEVECHPYILTSPVYVNSDTFVLVASFFPPEMIEGDLGDIVAEKRKLMTVHNLASHAIFEPLYNAILREGSRDLRKSLGRLNVSESLLKKASGELRPPSKETKANNKVIYKGKKDLFTYFWKNKTEQLSCADFRSHIYGDIQKKPENIFEVILELEEKVYENLKETWEGKPKEFKKIKSGNNEKINEFFKNKIPSKLDVSAKSWLRLLC